MVCQTLEIKEIQWKSKSMASNSDENTLFLNWLILSPIKRLPLERQILKNF